MISVSPSTLAGMGEERVDQQCTSRFSNRNRLFQNSSFDDEVQSATREFGVGGGVATAAKQYSLCSPGQAHILMRNLRHKDSSETLQYPLVISCEGWSGGSTSCLLFLDYTANDLRGPDIIRGQTSKDDRALNVKYFRLDVHGHPAIYGPPTIALSGYHGTSKTKDILWTSQLIGRVAGYS